MSKKTKKEKKKISKLNFLISLIVKVNNDNMTLLAAQTAYYFILSFFPFLFSIAAVIGLINLDSDLVINWLNNVLPSNVIDFIKGIVLEIVDTQSSSMFIISLATGFWITSRGSDAVIIGVNKAYNMTETRSYIKRKFIAYISTILLVITIAVALVVLVFGQIIETKLMTSVPFHNAVILIWTLLRYGILMLILVLVFAAIYKFTSCEKLKWKEVFPGAIISTIGWVVASWGFSIYIDNFNNYSKFYGSVAAIFILMIWLYLTALMILFGAEFNSVVARHKKIE